MPGHYDNRPRIGRLAWAESLSEQPIPHLCSLCGETLANHAKYVGHRIRAHDQLTLTACGAEGCTGNR